MVKFVFFLLVVVLFIGCAEKPASPDLVSAPDHSEVSKQRGSISGTTTRGVEVTIEDPSTTLRDSLNRSIYSSEMTHEIAYANIDQFIAETQSWQSGLQQEATSGNPYETRDLSTLYSAILPISLTANAGQIQFTGGARGLRTMSIDTTLVGQIADTLQIPTPSSGDYWINPVNLTDQQFIAYYTSKGFEVANLGGSLFEFKKEIETGPIMWVGQFDRTLNKFVSNSFDSGGTEIFNGVRYTNAIGNIVEDCQLIGPTGNVYRLKSEIDY